MAWMINNDTGEMVDMPDTDVKDALRLKIADFSEPKVPVRYYNKLPNGRRDPEDEWGAVRLYNKEEAKLRLLEDKDAHYVSPQQAYDWKVNKKYGSGYEGAAAALGVADMVTLNGASMLGESMGYPTREIAQANPWWHVLGDIGSTIGAVGLAAGSAAAPPLAPLAGSILSKEGAKWAAKFGARNVSKLTAPYWITKAGAKAPELIGKLATKGAKALPDVLSPVAASILKESGEQSLKRQAATGMLARTASLGTESLLYSTGYSVNDNLNEYIHGDPEKAKENMIYGMGVGTVLGMALPIVGGTVLHAGLGAAAGVRRAAKATIDYGISRKSTDKYLRSIADEAEELGVLHDVIKKDDLADQLSASKLGTEARKAQRGLIDNQEKVVGDATAHFDDMFDVHRDIQKVEQAGHTKGSLKTSLTEGIHPETPGAAATAPLVELLINGHFNPAKEVNQGGLLDILRDMVNKQLGGTVSTKEAGKTIEIPFGGFTEQAPLKIQAELKYIGNQIDELREYAAKWMQDRIKSLTSQQELWEEVPEWRRRLESVTGGWENRARGALDARQLVRGQKAQRETHARASSVMAMEPSLRGNLDQEFNAEVFSRLEKLSSRIHTGILEGRFQDVPKQQEFLSVFKKEVTDFLTGKQTWELGDETFGGFYPFGDPTNGKTLAGKKRYVNNLFGLKDGSYKIIRKKFAEVDPESLYPTPGKRASEAKVRDFMMALNHENSKSVIEEIASYAQTHKELAEYLRRNFDLPKGLHGKFLHDSADRAIKAQDSWNGMLKFLREKMSPALQYADMLKKEQREMSLHGFAKSLIPGPAAAVAGAATLAAGGGIGGAATVALAPGVIKSRLAMTPMKTVVQMERMFQGIKDRDKAVKDWITSFIKGYGKKRWHDPGISRWPRLFTSNIIGRYANTQSETDYRHKIKGSTKDIYGTAELKETRKALDALAKNPSLKNALVQEITAQVSGYAPELVPMVEDKIDEYLKLVQQSLPETIPGNLFNEDIEPSDLEIQEFAEGLAVLEHGPFAIFRSLSLGNLSRNEWEFMEKFYPSTARDIQKYALTTTTEMGSDYKENATESAKEQLAIIAGVNRVQPQLQKHLRATFAQEEEKPGPKPQAKWAEGRFPGTQLAGSYAVEKRRSVQEIENGTWFT